MTDPQTPPLITYTPQQIWTAYRASAGAVLRVSLKPAKLHHSPEDGLHVSWKFNVAGQEATSGFQVQRGERREGEVDITLHGVNAKNANLPHKVQIRFIRATDPRELGL